ncbi:hypothetical protein TVAG_105550 [Trichomonas vaginalis G3]|uniref:Uncharacterized protein n=1 Tax=Trichomonas vaginalis (strain ATCC PRA-98 / G3) TaxID=412133 RepID=A2G3W5_TRIV3|nr:hypothetical protein TVAGG3_0117030 [Trichomonas vaginalis G3]EAX88154.1 hypothetical protein TVAG_105550 [Trichomonas vaginalis G3]KAI5545240.1 hypothetical protein TVAGG3_0117030 [Trichomonas vaginalis G3]|eukprot:XP_001301084.1 hypothetical protein [Trichomonas vaginalis G3]
MTNINPENNTEYTATGVVYNDLDQIVKLNAPKRRNLIRQPPPRIYVDDGSNGFNLVYHYSYPQYAEYGSKLNVTNHYMNLYDEGRFHKPSQKESEFARLHEYADHDGYSDYSMPVRI